MRYLVSKQLRSRAFTLPELSIAVMLLSFISLATANYLKKNQTTLRSSDMQSSLQASAGNVQKILMDDLKQAAFINPSCAGNPGLGSATTPCSDIKIRGGIIPLPGATKDDLTSQANLAIPANISDNPSALANSSDGLRIVTFDFSSAFNCKLNSYRNSNPSVSAGAGPANERLWPLRTGCNGNLVVGKIYALMESVGANVFSNVFQVTALNDLGGGATSVDQLQVEAESSNSIYNQVGGLGLSGFSSSARIYPVKIIEWAVRPGEGIYRREIKPTAGSLNGFGQWNLVSDTVEDIQFFPVTLTATSAIEHQRTMQFTADTANNGIEDIKGISVRLVARSKQPTNDGQVYDNPLTNTVEGDHFPRQEVRFYADFKNTHPGS